MTRKPSTMLCASALVAGLAAPVIGAEAGQANEADALRNEVAQLRAEVAEMRQQKNEDWMSERRAEEVKAIVHDVLSDADTRATLLQEGMNAGYDDGFFIRSGDGGFELNVNGLVQTRYILNHADRYEFDDDRDDWEGGFTVPRARLQFSGHIASPRLEYKVRLNLDEEDNAAYFQTAKIGYQLRDDVKIWGGEFKDPFLREELIHPGRQLAVERSLVNEVFTLGYVQGVGVKWTPMDNLKVRGTLTDGARSGEAFGDTESPVAKDHDSNDKPFYDDDTDFALTGRADYAVSGNWDQARDFTAWSGEPMSLVFGGGVHYEAGETGDDEGNDDFWAWTVDASFEQQGWSAFAAVNGLHTDIEGGAGGGLGRYQDVYGAVGQVAYNIEDTYQPFLRYEYLDLDNLTGTGGDNHLNFVTAGFNWFNNRHNAKFTADVVWALDTVPDSHDALNIDDSDTLNMLGLLEDEDGEEDQVALRLQYQLMF